MNNLGEAICPYYKKESGNTLYCELAKLHFPDVESKTQIKEHCCNFDKYKDCTLYEVMTSYYDRKYKNPEGGCK